MLFARLILHTHAISVQEDRVAHTLANIFRRVRQGASVKLFLRGEEVKWMKQFKINWIDQMTFLSNEEIDEAYELYAKEVIPCE